MIFAIQDEPPTSLSADDDDEIGLESISDPEKECVDAEGAGDGEGSMRFFDERPSSASHAHPSTDYHSNSNSTTSSARARSEEEVNTEEDPVAPITLLPTTTRFDLSGGPKERDGAGEKRQGGTRRMYSSTWMRGGRTTTAMTSRTTGSTRCRHRLRLCLRR
jgi:hypothetical protein